MSKKDVKLSQNVKKKKKKNKRPISKFLTIFMFIALGAFIFQMIRLNLLPFKLIILVSFVRLSDVSRAVPLTSPEVPL